MTAEIWEIVGRTIRDDGELVTGGTGRYGKMCREVDSAALRDGKHTLAGPPGRADDLYCVATSCWKSQQVLIQAY